MTLYNRHFTALVVVRSSHFSCKIMCAASGLRPSPRSSSKPSRRKPSWFTEFTYCLDSELAWAIVRRAVAIQMFDDLSVVVPRLCENQHYKANCVVLRKEKNIVRQLIFSETPTFQPAGHISSLVTEITAECFDMIQKPLKKDPAWNMACFVKKYKKQIGDTKKRIELKIIDISKYKCDDLVNGTLRLSQTTLAAMLNSRKPPKLIYVVNTYFAAKKVQMLLKINDELKLFEKKNAIIAFELVRYDLTKDGMLQYSAPYWRSKLNKHDYWCSTMDVDWPEILPGPRIFEANVLANVDDDEDADDESTHSEDMQEKNPAENNHEEEGVNEEIVF